MGGFIKVQMNQAGSYLFWVFFLFFVLKFCFLNLPHLELRAVHVMFNPNALTCVMTEVY